jgi:hypothetical protein
MKALLFALVLVFNYVHAETWLEMPNEGGGKILLLEDRCNKTDKGRIALATLPDGTTYNGCWFYYAETVHVFWKDGQRTTYEPRSFSLKETK